MNCSMFLALTKFELITLKSSIVKYAWIHAVALLVLAYPIKVISLSPFFSANTVFFLAIVYSVGGLIAGWIQGERINSKSAKSFLLFRPVSNTIFILAVQMAAVLALVFVVLLPILSLALLEHYLDDLVLADALVTLAKVFLLSLIAYLSGFSSQLVKKRIKLVMLSIPVLCLLGLNSFNITVLLLIFGVAILLATNVGLFKLSNDNNHLTFSARMLLSVPVTLVFFITLSIFGKFVYQMGIVVFDSQHSGSWHDYFPNGSHQYAIKQAPDKVKDLVQKTVPEAFSQTEFVVSYKNNYVSFNPLSGTLSKERINAQSKNEITVEVSQSGSVQLLNNESTYIVEFPIALAQHKINRIMVFANEQQYWLVVIPTREQHWQQQPYLMVLTASDDTNMTQFHLQLKPDWSPEYLSLSFILSPGVKLIEQIMLTNTLTATFNNINSRVLYFTFILVLLSAVFVMAMNRNKRITTNEKTIWVVITIFAGLPALLTYLLLLSLHQKVEQPSKVPFGTD